MHETLTPNHQAMNEVSPLVDELRDTHDLTGEVQFQAAERVQEAGQMLKQIEDTVGSEELDSAVAGYVDHVEHNPEASDSELRKSVAVGVEELYKHPQEAPLTAHGLHEAPTEQLGAALKDFAAVEGDVAVKEIIEQIEKSGTGIPEFDELDDYSPEFKGQLLMHRSNAEFKVGDVVLPSNQISPEMHEELNARRSFRSTSSPHGSGDYDKKLVHAGTRDFGKTYGDYLYIVEPIEGDTLKWGENPGAGVDRSRRAQSPAIDLSKSTLATSDSYTGKQYNEVVSTQGFRVVERIKHEPSYSEAMLPWPVTQDAVQRHKDRHIDNFYTVSDDSGHDVTTFSKRTSRPKPSKIGAINSPGTYRAGATDQIAANLQTKFDVRKQRTEHPGQIAIPDMPIARYRVKNNTNITESLQPIRTEWHYPDEALPGMETIKPERPMV